MISNLSPDIWKTHFTYFRTSFLKFVLEFCNFPVIYILLHAAYKSPIESCGKLVDVIDEKIDANIGIRYYWFDASKTEDFDWTLDWHGL